jgi:glycosyltransferase involved in cell wall biosynthesis
MVFRKPLPSTHSIEYLFHNIFREINGAIAAEEFELPKFSTGLWNRLLNTYSMLRFRHQVVHMTGDCYYSILGALFSKRLITVHDLSFLTRTSGIKRKVLKLFWVSLPVHFAHKITVVSETTKQTLLKETNISPAKIQVVYNFIDPVYQPVERSFNSESPRILQVGTTFNKNIDNLTKALKGIPCKLMIIGRLSAQQVQLLKTSGIQYENKYSIPIHELHKEYLAADMLTFVSTVEGFGMPILEAQATGLPVITSNCSSMPEVAGGGALLVDPFDPNAIRQGVLEIINNKEKRNRLVETGYRNVKQYSKEKIAADYLSVYQSLLDKS